MTDPGVRAEGVPKETGGWRRERQTKQWAKMMRKEVRTR